VRIVNGATQTLPPDKLGFVFMLAGDTGVSNTDPWRTKPAPGNHWVKTGSHLMIVGLAVKKMTGFPRMPDPDPTKPYMMWPGTPYEHIMLPCRQTRSASATKEYAVEATAEAARRGYALRRTHRVPR